MFRSQNKSKGKTGLEHDVALCSARSFPHTLTPWESKALDDIRVGAGLIMHGITPRIFKGKLNLKSQAEWRNATDLSRAGQHPQYLCVTDNLPAEL